jgi:hypothetical protein
MTVQPRTLVAACSVLLFAVANVTAAALGFEVEGGRLWMLLCAVLAIAAAMQSVAWEPADLLAAMALSLVPLVGLVAAGGSIVLVGVLGVLLLLGAEFNVLSWELEGAGPSGVLLRQRLVSLAAARRIAVAQMVAWMPFVSGMAAVIVPGRHIQERPVARVRPVASASCRDAWSTSDGNATGARGSLSRGASGRSNQPTSCHSPNLYPTPW